jgi:flagellar basal-body rod protein FlgB
MGSTSLLQVLEGYLKVTADRQQMVATNMANVDTPGYHTKDIDFRAAMQSVMDQGGEPRTEAASTEVLDLPERPDGNNVNIDREGMMMSQAQLQYQMGVQLIKGEFHTLLSAIKD